MQNYTLVKSILIYFISIVLLILLPEIGMTFNKSLALVTNGIDSPHILKSSNFSLNARNVKVIRSQGNNLWMGTSMGVIKYNKLTANDYIIYDNRNALLSNGIFSIVIGPKNKIWIGTYGGGISKMDNNKWVNFNTPQGLNDSFVYDQEFTKDSIWIAT